MPTKCFENILKINTQYISIQVIPKVSHMLTTVPVERSFQIYKDYKYYNNIFLINTYLYRWCAGILLIRFRPRLTIDGRSVVGIFW